MMLITMDGCYLIDRSFNFRRVQMRFPCRQTSEVCGIPRLASKKNSLDVVPYLQM